jgi:hypothetical protein
MMNSGTSEETHGDRSHDLDDFVTLAAFDVLVVAALEGLILVVFVVVV